MPSIMKNLIIVIALVSVFVGGSKIKNKISVKAQDTVAESK
jgi:hypothetical protein